MRRILMLCCTLLLAACAGVGNLEKPQVSLAGLALDDFNLFEQRFLVTLRVTNPNDTSVTVDGVDFDLMLNGEHFASGVGRDQVTLPRMGEALVTLKVTTNLGSLWKQIRALQTTHQPLAYRMTGKLHTPWRPGGIPFDRKGELPALNEIFPDTPMKDQPKLEKL